MDLLNNNIRSKCLTPKTALRSVSIQVQLNQELKTHMNTIANINPDTAQSVFSGICPTREGVQSSSNSNHRHPNLFCGKRAPQLLISTTSISNHHKILFSVI